MNLVFKKFFTLIVLIGLTFNFLTFVNSFPFKAQAVSISPVSLFVLYSHAQSNNEKEDKFKLMEALFSIVNQASHYKVPLKDMPILSHADLSLELFRVVKYLRKYLENKKRDKLEKDNKRKEHLKDSKRYNVLVNDFKLTEQDILEIFENDLGFIDDYKDNFQDKVVSDVTVDKDKPKGWLFKIKIVVCLFLLIDEFLSRLDSPPFSRGINSNDLIDNSLVSKSLRYFLLSESGSFEAKFSIVLFLTSFAKIIFRDIYRYNRLNTYINGYDSNGFDYFGFNKDGYNDKGYDFNGFNKDGYNDKGYDFNGFDKDGYGWDGYDEYCYDRNGYDRYGCGRNGYDRDGFDKYGYNKFGWSRNGFDRMGKNSRYYINFARTYKQEAMKFFELGEGFTFEGLRARYKEFSKKWHPDKNGNSTKSTEMFKKINNYYLFLKK